MKTCGDTKKRTQVYLASLFLTAKNWKLFNYSSNDKWMKKRWSINIKEYYLAIKKSTDICHIMNGPQKYYCLVEKARHKDHST